MSIHSEVVCDLCNKRESAVFNGEHHIAPEEWAELTTPKFGVPIGLHICFDCTEKMKSRKNNAYSFVPKNLKDQIVNPKGDDYDEDDYDDETF